MQLQGWELFHTDDHVLQLFVQILEAVRREMGGGGRLPNDRMGGQKFLSPCNAHGD